MVYLSLVPYRPDKPRYTAADRDYTEHLTWPEWVVLRRLRLGWTKQDLADKCEDVVSRMTLWRIEMSLVKPTRATQRAIESVLDQGERELAEELGAVSTTSVPV